MTPAPDPRTGTPPAATAAPAENLALIFQELLTVIVRLRADRQEIPSAETFRGQVLKAIKIADQNAKAAGYTDDDIRLGVFAVVALLDETILNLRKPIFKEWVRKPLQEELFGRHVAGEVFFENLQQLLGRRDSPELADLLEVYLLCILLGYLGRYSITGKGELRALMGQMEDKIRRIRKARPDLSPRWALPEAAVKLVRSDPWFYRLLVVAGACALLVLVLFSSYRISLGSGVTSVQELARARSR